MCGVSRSPRLGHNDSGSPRQQGTGESGESVVRVLCPFRSVIPGRRSTPTPVLCAARCAFVPGGEVE